MKKRTIKLPKKIIVPHVHSRSMRQRYKTTILETLRLAIASFVSVIVIMPNTNPGIINEAILLVSISLLNRARRILGIGDMQRIWFGTTNNNFWECKKALQNFYVVGLKVYSNIIFSTRQILKLMRLCARAGKPIAFHCDHPMIIAKEGYSKKAEVEYVRLVLYLAHMVPGVKIYFCHISCRESAELILAAQKEGIQAVIEICVNYLWFDSEGTNWNPGLDPKFYDCLNRLRTKKDREFIISLLLTGNPLIVVSSDHAPHTKEEKLAGANGIPSIMEVVPVMITLAIKHNIPEWRLAQLLSWNVSNFLNIPSSIDMIEYEIEERKHDLQYGPNIVNPWNGSVMWFPVKKIEEVRI
jgi:dihydroorotase